MKSTNHEKYNAPKVQCPVLAVSVEDGAQSLNISRSAAYLLIRDGNLRSVKIGKRRLILVSELQAFAARLQEAAAPVGAPGSADGASC